jgi:hypothetical protein
MRLVGPAVARYFGPGPDDMIDTFFDGTPMPVTIEVYPFSPATRITGQKLAINGASREFTGVSGQNPASLQFLLGGDSGETAGGINTVSVSVTDDAGATTHFSLRYFRVANQGPQGTATQHPMTTPDLEPYAQTHSQTRRAAVALAGAGSR